MAKTKKFVYANIPGVPGFIYYLEVGGKKRTLVCISCDNKTVVLTDLTSGFLYNWDIRHFSYMVRQHRWRDVEQPQNGSTQIQVKQELDVKHEVEVKQEMGAMWGRKPTPPKAPRKEKKYTPEELDALADEWAKLGDVL